MSPTFIAQIHTFIAGLTAFIATITPSVVPATPTQISGINPINIPANSGTSRNWAGYATTAGRFTAVSATWTIPQIGSSGHTAADATWVGIGGIKSDDLIQAGTQDIVDSNGRVSYSAFYEMLPDASQSIPVTVKSGDAVSVSLNQTSIGQWQVSFKDATTGQLYQTTLDYNSSLSSAEWIEEAPSDGRSTIPLDNFDTIVFSAGSTMQNNNPSTIAQADGQAIAMINYHGQTLATPSELNSDGMGFTVSRTNAVSNSPVPQYDHNPRSWRRRGHGIGYYTPHPTVYYYTVTPSPVTGETPPVLNQPTPLIIRRIYRFIFPVYRFNRTNRQF